MDKFVIREPREFLQQSNQMPNFMMHKENSNNLPPNPVYSGGYSVEAPINRTNSGYMSASHSHMNLNSPSPYGGANAMPGPGQMVSGIEPRYLASYADGSAAYIAGAGQFPVQQRMNDQSQISAFSEDGYQSRQLSGPDRMRNAPTLYGHQSSLSAGSEVLQRVNREQNSMNKTGYCNNDYRTNSGNRGVIGYEHRRVSFTSNLQGNQGEQMDRSNRIISFEIPSNKVANAPPSLPASFLAEMEPLKKEVQNPTKTRFEKLKALHNSGPRAFSGPVDKVLKWHKALQDIGLLVYYEIVAKCVSVRPGDTCAKNLVVRDENGPAMQIVYYEIDFLLPELKPPCTIRVIGRMMPGTCRLQAFNVRLATGDDVATLPRRAAVASHHVAKLCKEYGSNSV